MEIKLGLPFEAFRVKQQGLLLTHLVASQKGPLYSVVLLSMTPTNSTRVRLLLPTVLVPVLRAAAEGVPGPADGAGLPAAEKTRAFFRDELKLLSVGPPAALGDDAFWTLAPEAGWSLETLLRGVLTAYQRKSRVFLFFVKDPYPYRE